jgi:dolichyl-phosphate-mannose-protein mannosyltransferase
MSTASPAGSQLRQRGEKSKKRGTTPIPDGASSENDMDIVSKAKQQFHAPKSSDWDYKVALAIITVLAFMTRFYAISHPNQVVFDEVHFGKVRVDVSFF